MSFKFWRVLHLIAKLGRPLLRLAGVKDSTVAGKVAEGAEKVDAALTEEQNTKPK